MTNGNDLLLWMAAATQRDDAPPGFTGSLAVGVEGDGPSSWLLLSFAGARAQATFSNERPSGALAELALTHDEAETMMRTGALAATLSPERVRGERQLLGQFARRYLASVSLIDFMAAQSN